MDEKEFPRRLSFYKAKKSGDGSAMRFDLNPKRESVFVEAAVQKDEKTFDWENKIVFKLAANDISKLLATLEGKTQKMDLFHDPSKSPFVEASKVKNTALTATKSVRGYTLRLSLQEISGSVRSVSFNLNEDEAVLLRVLLARSLERIFNW